MIEKIKEIFPNFFGDLISDVTFERFESAEECKSHPYLTRKKIKPFGIRVSKKNALLIPISDINGELVALERINKNGESRIIPKKGTTIRGGFFAIGDWKEANAIILCIGYEEAATLYDALCIPVIDIIVPANGLTVSEEIHRKYPEKKLIYTFLNVFPGLDMPIPPDVQKIILRIAGCTVVYPAIAEGGEPPRTFNELYLLYGREALRDCFDFIWFYL